jgi:hypothetical protein
VTNEPEANVEQSATKEQLAKAHLNLMKLAQGLKQHNFSDLDIAASFLGASFKVLAMSEGAPRALAYLRDFCNDVEREMSDDKLPDGNDDNGGKRWTN